MSPSPSAPEMFTPSAATRLGDPRLCGSPQERPESTGGSWNQFFRLRPPLWKEAAVVIWLLWVYDAVDNLSRVRVDQAVGHATSLVDLEGDLHIGIEAALNRFTSAHHLLALIVADYYDNAHFVVTFAVLGWLWVAKPDRYAGLRRALIAINLIGFAVFLLYPMAPPRMLSGFVDTVAATHAIGSWHSGRLAADANQYAAMPSLHLGWAVWSSAVVWSLADSRAVRTAAVTYPFVTLFSVLATANHLLVDSLAGAATAVIALAAGPSVVKLISRTRG